MKENMIAVGSYLFAGLLSFALLVAAAKYLNEDPSVPVTAASQDASPLLTVTEHAYFFTSAFKYFFQ